MDISVKDLQEAISIRQQIDNLQRHLSSLLRGAPQRPTVTTAPTAAGRFFSPATRAKLAAAARARWARRRGTGAATPATSTGSAAPGKKGSAYTCRPKEAFPANESSLGGKKFFKKKKNQADSCKASAKFRRRIRFDSPFKNSPTWIVAR